MSDTGVRAGTCQIVVIQELYSIRLAESRDTHFHTRRVGRPASRSVVHNPSTQERMCEMLTTGVHLLTLLAPENALKRLIAIAKLSVLAQHSPP